MTEDDDIEDRIRSENGNQPSCEDQVYTAYWFLENEITAPEETVVRTNTVYDQIGHRLDHGVRTVLDNLEDINILERRAPPGGGSYIRHHRTGRNFFDPRAREWVPLLDEEVSRFIDDMNAQDTSAQAIADGGEDETEDESPITLRSVAAEALDVEQHEVEEELTEPEDVERMNNYDLVVGAIERNEEVSRNGNYDAMGWRNMAIRWTLSAAAVALEN